MKTDDLQRLLHRKYAAVSPGNGPRYVIAPEVRNQAGFGGGWSSNGLRLRTCDLIVMDTWPSGPVRLIGHELKCSRSDWKRELDDPAKAAAFIEVVAEWWLVTGSAKIVQPGELPEGWGLIVASQESGRLHTVTAATRKPQPTIPLGLTAAMMRATQGIGRAELERAKQPKPHTIQGGIPMAGTYDSPPAATYRPPPWPGDIRPANWELRHNPRRDPQDAVSRLDEPLIEM